MRELVIFCYPVETSYNADLHQEAVAKLKKSVMRRATVTFTLRVLTR